MVTKIPERPYPTIGEIYRVLAAAFGTKNKNRDLDRMARDGDFNHHLRKSLLDDLFREPLSKKVQPKFAELFCNHLDDLISNYVELVKSVGIDALTRAESLPHLVEHFFGRSAESFLRQIHKVFGGPAPSAYYVATDGNALGVACIWLENNISSFAPFLGFQDKAQRDQFRKWVQGKELPKSTSFSALLAEFPESPDKQSILIHLTVGRALQHILKLSSEYGLFDLAIKRSKESSKVNIRRILNEANRDAGKRFYPIPSIASETFSMLNRKKKKKHTSKDDSWVLLTEFEKQLSLFDPEGITGHHLAWQKARWHVYSGQYKEALSHYKAAFDLTIYRAENLHEILKEALAVAAFQRDMVFLKQLKNQAIAFDIFNSIGQRDSLSKAHKKTKGNVIEDWEVEQWTIQFSMLFPPENCFPGCINEKKHKTEFPFLQEFDPDTYDKKPDLKRPNRMVSIDMKSERMKRRYPQLVLYARCNQPDNVKALLDAGADVDMLSSISESALLFSLLTAVNTGDRRCFDLLKKHKHSYETMNIKTDKKKLTVLLQAVETGVPDIVDSVLTMGAEIDRPGNMDDQTALNMCIKNLAILTKTPEQFINHFKDIKPDDHVLIDSARRTSFGILGSTEQETGSIINDIYDHPLSQIFREQNLEVYVQKKKERFNRDDLLEIAIMLLERKANPNAEHPSPITGYTPLMLAVENNEPDLVELMLKKGGNPYRTYQHGSHPIDCWRIARGFGSYRALNVLERHRR